jgi:hypothetical protein
MNPSHAVIVSSEEAVDTWHRLSKECEIFNMHTEIETTGHVVRSISTLGVYSLIKVPQIEKDIERHILRLDSLLDEFQKGVESTLSISHDEDNIYEILISAEQQKYGGNLALVCGYTESEKNYSEYECNIGEVAFHLIAGKNFWADGGAYNAVQDISRRYKMVCRAKRGFPGARKFTPRLSNMPNTPLSEKLKKYISSQIERQGDNLVDYLAAAADGFKKVADKHPLLEETMKGLKSGDSLRSAISSGKFRDGMRKALGRIDRSKQSDQGKAYMTDTHDKLEFK